MSISVDISERQLRIGVIQLGASIAVLLAIGTFVVSLLLPKSSEFSFVPVEAMMFALAFSILVSGVRSFLSMIDWFEGRRSKQKTDHG